MPAVPVTRNAIVALLQEEGPMSVFDIANTLGWTRYRVNGSISGARENHPGKFFKIVRYDVQRGKSGREIPVYAAAGGSDARWTKLGDATRKERQKRYYERHKARLLTQQKVTRAALTGAAPVNPWLNLFPAPQRQSMSNSLRAAAMNAARTTPPLSPHPAGFFTHKS